MNLADLKVVVLAAGCGNRFRPPTRRHVKPLRKVAGLPLVVRALLTARAAGFREFVVVVGFEGAYIRERLEHDRRLRGLSITWVENPDWERGNGMSLLKARDAAGERFVVLMADHVIEPRAFAPFETIADDPGHSYLVVDRDIASIGDIDDATKVKVEGSDIREMGKEISDYNGIDTGIFLFSREIFDHLEEVHRAKGDVSLTDGNRALARLGRLHAVDADGLTWEDVDSPEALKRAERKLFASLVKKDDSKIARNINRRVSIPITRLLVRTPVTPNQMTVFTFGVGLLSAWLFALGGYRHMLLGAILFQLASILDGCDGELARLKFKQSKLGAWLDTVADTATYVIVFPAIGRGIYMARQTPFFHAAAWLTTIGVILAVALMTVMTLTRVRSGSMSHCSADLNKQLDSRRKNPLERFIRRYNFIVKRSFFALFTLFCALTYSMEFLLLGVMVASNIAWVCLLYVLLRGRGGREGVLVADRVPAVK